MSHRALAEAGKRSLELIVKKYSHKIEGGDLPTDVAVKCDSGILMVQLVNFGSTYECSAAELEKLQLTLKSALDRGDARLLQWMETDNWLAERFKEWWSTPSFRPAQALEYAVGRVLERGLNAGAKECLLSVMRMFPEETDDAVIQSAQGSRNSDAKRLRILVSCGADWQKALLHKDCDQVLAIHACAEAVFETNQDSMNDGKEAKFRSLLRSDQLNQALLKAYLQPVKELQNMGEGTVGYQWLLHFSRQAIQAPSSAWVTQEKGKEDDRRHLVLEALCAPLLKWLRHKDTDVDRRQQVRDAMYKLCYNQHRESQALGARYLWQDLAADGLAGGTGSTMAARKALLEGMPAEMNGDESGPTVIDMSHLVVVKHTEKGYSKALHWLDRCLASLEINYGHQVLSGDEDAAFMREIDSMQSELKLKDLVTLSKKLEKGACQNCFSRTAPPLQELTERVHWQSWRSLRCPMPPQTSLMMMTSKRQWRRW